MECHALDAADAKRSALLALFHEVPSGGFGGSAANETDVDTERQRRVGENESFFREVNERIEDSARGGGQERQAFVCECGSLDCADYVTLALDDYERVRSHGARFVILPGHDIPGAERIVEEHEDYAVVEKIAAAAEVAAARNPRS